MRSCTLTIMALLTAVPSVQAQTVLMTDRMSGGGFEPIPKELSADNVAYMAVYNYHTNRKESELMVARSQTDVKVSVNIDNAGNSGNYWQKSKDGVNWVYDPEMTYLSEEYEPTLLSFIYRDVDNSYYPTSLVYLSQNIFNTDSRWEYVVADVEFSDKPEPESEYSVDGVSHRHVVRTKIIKGFKIMNENGTEVAYCKVPDDKSHNEFTTEIEGYYIARIDGMLYMATIEIVGRTTDNRREYHGGLYLINPSTSSVQAIGRVNSRISVNSTDGGIKVMVSEPGAGESVSLIGMDGKLIDRTPASENVSFPKPGTGIYNVTLTGNNGNESLKVQVK